MAMYETIFILDSLLATEEIDKVVDRIKELIETNGGKVVTVDKWGKRRLAYEIQKKQYGFYVAIEFESEGPLPNSLVREYNFNDKILRYLTYRYTENKIKARNKEIEILKNQPATVDVDDSKMKPEVEKKPEVKQEPKAEQETDVKKENEEVENA